ncbi:unnamed protein product [Rotaria socialis]|uniref:Uncharacterized protein n=1 Tax=Rotaria socialis TaxID=392032 RepID=A0A820UIW7_9BILA|nr:unnamed protein product [Rotaria socialis]
MASMLATALALGLLCGISVVLILIATTIVLSLIPIYLSDHGSTLNYLKTPSQFYIQYSTSVNNATTNYSAFTSDLTSATQQLNNQLGLSPNTVKVSNIQVVQASSSGRRRRNSRRKRALSYKMLLTCVANYPRTCIFNSCQQRFLASILQKCSSSSSITFQLRSTLAADQIIEFAMNFIGFTFAGKLEM